jgi:hypothetical protein
MTHTDLEKICGFWAWSVVRTHGVEFGDAQSQAHLFALEYARKWDPERGASLSTWTWNILKQKMPEWAKKTRGNCGFGEQPEPQCPIQDPEAQVAFMELIANLPEDARSIVAVLLENPAAVMDESGTGSPKRMRGALVRLCRKRFGGSAMRWWDAVAELRQVFA